MQASCVFCQIAAGQAPAQIVYEDERVVAFRDLHPKAPTHVLIIPRQHITNVNAAEADEASLLGELLLAAARIAQDEGLEGYRLVTNNGAEAGQSVFHLHIHLLGGRRFSWPPG